MRKEKKEKREKKVHSNSGGGGRLIIDIGNQTTKIIEASIVKKKVVIKNVYKLDTSRYVANKDITNVPLLVEGIAQYLGENKVKSKKISLMFTSKALETNFEAVPQMNKKEMKEYIKGAMADKFLNKTDKTHCMDYGTFGDVVMESGGSHSAVIMAALPKTQVNALVKEFKKYGYKVDEVDTHISSLIYLYSILEYDYENNTKILVDIGYTVSYLLVMHLGVPIAFREFSGIAKVAEYIRKEIDIPPTMLNELIMSVGLDKDSLPDSAYDLFDSLGIEEFLYFEELDRAIEMNILEDIRKSIDFYEQSMKLSVKKVFTVGGGSLITGIGNALERHTKAEVEVLEIVSSVTNEEYTIANGSNVVVDGSFGTCVGMAIKGAI